MKWSVINRKLARIERVIDKSIDNAEMAGSVVLARMPKEGELIEYQSVRGFALMRPERIPMRRDTIFDLASLTKPIATTTAVMLLIADGVIALDDPVAKALPSFADRDKDEVTVRQLLSHCAGLRPWRGFHELLISRERKTGERLLGTAEGREWILDRVLRSALVHEPGEAAVYGDLDFIALGALVEALSGQSLDAFCEERIFKPLGLHDTQFFPELPDEVAGVSEGGSAPPSAERERRELLKRRIAGTENCPWRKRIIWGEVHDPNASAMGGVAGHAGLFSTADDVMRFAQTFLDVWHGRNEALPRECVRSFCERQKLPETSDWALGWDTPTPGTSSSGQYFSVNSVGHLGFTGTSLWIDLETEAVVILLTNRCHQVAKYSRFELRPVVHDLVREALDEG
jgi:CubicO group peptidase (beta-lactamase class C family)